MTFLQDPHVQLMAGLLLVTALFVYLLRRVLLRFARRLHAAPADARQLRAAFP